MNTSCQLCGKVYTFSSYRMLRYNYTGMLLCIKCSNKNENIFITKIKAKNEYGIADADFDKIQSHAKNKRKKYNLKDVIRFASEKYNFIPKTKDIKIMN